MLQDDVIFPKSYDVEHLRRGALLGGKMPDLTQAQLASVNNFVSMSVTEGTRRAYERDWTA